MSSHDNADRRLTLDQLPPELLSNILEFVDARGQSTEIPRHNRPYKRLNVLRRMSLVSKAFYEATKPCLYRVADITGLKNPKVRLFLRTLCSNAHLACYVKGLRLGEHVYRAKQRPSLEELGSYLVAISQFRNRELKAEIYESLMQGCATAETALILVLATNVQTLDLDMADTTRSSRAENRWQKRMLCTCCPNMAQCLGSILARDPAMYKDLRRIKLWSSPDQIASTTHNIPGQLLRLPLLEDVTLLNFCTPSVDTGTLSSPGQSRVSDLKLQYCALDTSSIVDLINGCKKLSSFETEDSSEKVDSDKLLAALRQHSAHLRKLIVRTPEKYRPLFKDNKPIGDLCSFEELKHVELDSDVLIGTSQWYSNGRGISELPLSMKTFKINTYNDLSDLEDILRAIQSKFPSSLDLLVITFPCDKHPNREYVDVIEEEDFMEDGNVKTRADLGWSTIVACDIKRLGLRFSCWKDSKSIQDKIGGIAKQISEHGIRKLLEDYYADWEIEKGNYMHQIRKDVWRDEQEFDTD